MAIRLLLLFLAMMSAGVKGATAQAVTDIGVQLSTHSPLRGTFAQTKQIEGFRNPLRSSGRFVMARQHGVLWETTAPFPSAIVLSQAQLISRQPDGSVKVLLSAADSGAIGAVHGLLMALIVGDFDQLSTQFEIQALPSESGWALLLKPTDPALLQAFVEIELRGDQFVRQLKMVEVAGDRSQIDFSDLRTEPAQLTPAEAQLFE